MAHHGEDDEDDGNRPPSYPPPPNLPPETYNHLIHALLSLQGSSSHSYPPEQPFPAYPPSYPNYPWPPAAPAVPTAPVAGPSSYYPQPIPHPLHAVPQSAGPSQPTPSFAPSTSTAQDPEGAEEKRRRNTVASARFRIKKRLHTLNLERSVADLTGRTEELEREAADLRRENTWLKEIVLLKGRNIAAMNAASHEDRHDDDEQDEPDAGSSARRRDKGKDKET